MRCTVLIKLIDNDNWKLKAVFYQQTIYMTSFIYISSMFYYQQYHQDNSLYTQQNSSRSFASNSLPPSNENLSSYLLAWRQPDIFGEDYFVNFEVFCTFLHFQGTRRLKVFGLHGFCCRINLQFSKDKFGKEYWGILWRFL